jgi:hypothetical protein
MPLSEYEQRVLEELERDLGADPKLGRTMSRKPHARGRLTWAVLGVIAGLGIVVAGAVSQMLVLGVAGFAVMAGSALWGLLAPRHTHAASSEAGTTDAGGQGKRRKADKDGFMRRVEERFDRRREQGDL